MSKMKRNIAVVVALAVLVAAVCFFIPEVRYRLYPFNRIKGNITVITDGTVCHLTEDNFSFPKEGDRDYYGTKGKGKVKIKDDTAEISFRGGKYGGYLVDIIGFADDQPVSVTFFQANWWNVQRFDITVAVDTASGNVLFEGNDIVSGDKEHISFAKNYKNEGIQINIGL